MELIDILPEVDNPFSEQGSQGSNYNRDADELSHNWRKKIKMTGNFQKLVTGQSARAEGGAFEERACFCSSDAFKTTRI